MNLVLFFCVCMCGTEDQIQDLSSARQLFYCWPTLPAEIKIASYFFVGATPTKLKLKVY